MFDWFKSKQKVLHVSFSREELLFFKGLFMSVASELKDAVSAVDSAADKVVAAIADLKATNANALTAQEISDIKSSLGGVKTKLDNAVV